MEANDETSLLQQDGNGTKYETDEEEFDETSNHNEEALNEERIQVTGYETDEEKFSSHQEDHSSQEDKEPPTFGGPCHHDG